MTDSRTRIYFELDPDDWHGGGMEGLWAERVESSDDSNIYRILNSPFYALGISFLDIVRATPRAEEARSLNFHSVLERSGHSTYVVLVPLDSAEFDGYWARLEKLGCTYESASNETTPYGERSVFSIDVPPSADIHSAYSVLQDGEDNKVWLFQENHCGHPNVSESGENS